MKKQNFIKGSIILMISAVVSKIFGAVFKIPLANMLGGVGMSYFSCAYSIFLPVYAFSVSGLSSACARLTAQSTAFNMYDNALKVRRTAFVLFSLTGIAGSFLIYISARPFAALIGGCPEAELSVKIIAPSVLFGCMTACERGYYEGLCNMYPTAFSQFTESVVKMFCGLFFCFWVNKNSSLVLGWFPEGTDIRCISASAGILGVTLSSVGGLLFFPVMKCFCHEKKMDSDKTLMSAKDISRELLLTALPIGASAVASNLSSIIDMGTITSIISRNPHRFYALNDVPTEDIPHFLYGSFAGTVLTVFNLIPSVTNMLGKSILPSITEAWESKNTEALQKNSTQAIAVTLFISAPATFGMGVLAEKILSFLYSGQSKEVMISIRPLQLLMPGMLFLCVSFPLFSMLQAVGKPSAPLKIMLCGTLVKLAGNLILIPFMGINGASVSTSVSYAVILALSVIIYSKATNTRFEIKHFLPILYSAVFCGVAAWITDTQLSPRLSINTMFISVIAGAAAYFSMLIISRKTD